MNIMIGTSTNYWLNIQSSFDALTAEFKKKRGEREAAADRYAADSLIPPECYKELRHKYRVKTIFNQ